MNEQTMPHDWRMTIYDVNLANGRVELAEKAHRFVYVRDGKAFVEKGGTEVDIQAGEGTFSIGVTRIRGKGTVWVYEVGPNGRDFAANLSVSIVLSRRFGLDLQPPWLLRADRIESTSGSATPRHGHRGPGMRRLVNGRLMAEIGDNFQRINAGDAWFETGLDPVVGTNIHTENSVFVRVMILPIELKGGKSSFMPATPEDAARPRSVTNRIFGEVVTQF